MSFRTVYFLLALPLSIGAAAVARAEGDWEITPKSEESLYLGLQWLASNQGAEGNWESNDLGLVAMGALAFMAAGHAPGRGRFGEAASRALDYVVRHERPSGLLNIANSQHDMYNHGLSTFVLGQAYGMSGDPRIGAVLERGLALIAATQADDGGWQYQAKRMDTGHDLSLAVMQAKALRSAVDIGLDVPPHVIRRAIESVRRHYTPEGCPYTANEETQKNFPGQFTYTRGGGNASLAMAAAGVVCLQEFAQYDDWRISKNMTLIRGAILSEPGNARAKRHGSPPFDAYTLYYVAQALYQVGGEHWKECYPPLRDSLIATQTRERANARRDGVWAGRGRVGGKPGDLYMTAAACFVLAIPNRYLPILQEGRIGSLREKFRQPN